MAKKKASSKKSKPVKKVNDNKGAIPKSDSDKAKAKSVPAKKNAAKKKTKKYTGKKRGRKPSSPNRYNDIKSAISQNYLESVGRKIKRYELKIIYNWIKDSYGKQSLRYVLMNIDVIIDNFWKQYCNLYPIDINNHARFFEWYNFKNFLFTEKKYHLPTDIIQVDLNAVGLGMFEFFFEDYTSKCEEYYEMLKAEGIKRESPPPALYLVDAVCDISRKGNLYIYKLMMDEDIPTANVGSGSVSGGNSGGGANNNTIANNNTQNNNSGTTQGAFSGTNTNLNLNDGSKLKNDNKGDNLSNVNNGNGNGGANNQNGNNNGGNGNINGLNKNGSNDGANGNNNQNTSNDTLKHQADVEIQKERIKAEFNLREQKLSELRLLLKDKVITFDEYIRGIKEV